MDAVSVMRNIPEIPVTSMLGHAIQSVAAALDQMRISATTAPPTPTLTAIPVFVTTTGGH